MFCTTLRYLLVTTMLCLFHVATGQPPRGPWIASPQIHTDKTVTFRYLAPLAKEVKISTQFEKNPVNMTRDSIGIWSVTLGPVKPDIYPYHFIVDGISVMDPANVAFFPNERFKGSLVDIPDQPPLVHALQNVPHGTVTYEYYASAEGTTGTLVVYTPPGYEKNKQASYPVFYLISGTTDTEETWFKVGKANLILDNLIAEAKAKPMILVMPYGNIAARVAAQQGGAKPGDPTPRDGAEALSRSKAFEDDLMNNIIPYIEKNYRTIPNAGNRAIAGFSRGGGQTLRIAFGHPDAFSWVCSFSANLSEKEIDTYYGHIVSNPPIPNIKWKLFWIGVGTDDFLYKPVSEFIDYLKAKNVNHKILISSGGHTWMNTKLYLTETAQILFK